MHFEVFWHYWHLSACILYIQICRYINSVKWGSIVINTASIHGPGLVFFVFVSIPRGNPKDVLNLTTINPARSATIVFPAPVLSAPAGPILSFTCSRTNSAAWSSSGTAPHSSYPAPRKLTRSCCAFLLPPTLSCIFWKPSSGSLAF